MSGVTLWLHFCLNQAFCILPSWHGPDCPTVVVIVVDCADCPVVDLFLSTGCMSLFGVREFRLRIRLSHLQGPCQGCQIFMSRLLRTNKYSQFGNIRTSHYFKLHNNVTIIRQLRPTLLHTSVIFDGLR